MTPRHAQADTLLQLEVEWTACQCLGILGQLCQLCQLGRLGRLGWLGPLSHVLSSLVCTSSPTSDSWLHGGHAQVVSANTSTSTSAAR